MEINLGFPSEIYGKPLRDVLGEAAYATIRPYVERVLAGEQVTFESQISYQDGAVCAEYWKNP